MNILTRRNFLQISAAGMLASVPGTALAGASRKPRIKIGQIGTGHAHASGKMEAIRASEDWEVIGIVEPDPKLRERAEQAKAYAGLTWMTEEQLLNTPGLHAVAVETEVKDLVPTATRCVAAGKHIHLDKPGGESFPEFKAMIADAARQ